MPDQDQAARKPGETKDYKRPKVVHTEKIQTDRLMEARATGADVLATACPKCQIHFRCAMKDPTLGADLEIEMTDVAQLAEAALKES